MIGRRFLAVLATVVVAGVVGWLAIENLLGQDPMSSSAEVRSWEEGDPVFEAVERRPRILGANYHPMWPGMDDGSRQAVLDQVQASGLEWVRIDVGWVDFQPDGPDAYDMQGGVAKVDQRIREARNRGLRILLLFYWAPQWSSGTAEMNGRPGDPNDYAAAASWVAGRYDGSLAADLKIDAIELWNEPDLDRFWAKSPETTRVSGFAELVAKAGPSVRAANPDLTVVSGGISKADLGWFDAFYESPAVVGAYDAMGFHPYPSPSDQPPTALDPSEPQFSMTSITTIDEVMAEHGDPAPIWVTEFGWSTHTNLPLSPNWRRGVTEDDQAQYLLDSMAVLTTSSRVEAAFWYTIWATRTDDSHLNNFGLVTSDFRRKPGFFALKCAARGICGPS